MNASDNNDKHSSMWLDEALDMLSGKSSTYLSNEEPSADFLDRCQAAALCGLDVLKMRMHRGTIATKAGSLSEHFRSLAEIAGISLDRVFRILSIENTGKPSPSAARRLAYLASQLGLASEEAILRLRLGFAIAVGGSSRALLDIMPVRRRGGEHSFEKTHLVASLRRFEANYDKEVRTELRNVINAFAEVYED